MMNLKYHFLITLSIGLIAISSNAFAQENSETNPAPATESISETVVEDVVSQPSQNDSDPDSTVKLDPNDKLYWAKMRDVYTFQRKDFRKDGRFSLTLYTGIIPNDVFQFFIPVGLRLNYYLAENIGIELSSSYDIKIPTSLADNLQYSPVKASSTNGDMSVSHTNVGVLWSPLYGKMSWYKNSITYFDLYIFAGAGLAITQIKIDTAGSEKHTVQYNYKAEGSIGLGSHFFLSPHTLLRLDYRQFIFTKTARQGGVSSPSEITLAFGWIF